MIVQEIINIIEQFAPLAYQESYDNSGVQVGDTSQVVSGTLLTLDITEAVVDEAINQGCNLIIAHHPVIFSGLKRITGKNYVERAVMKAIKHDIVLYAAHTNLDNVQLGVNNKIAQRLGLINTSILQPSTNHALCKIYIYVPASHAPVVKDAMFHAGAGNIGKYEDCSFQVTGEGDFKPKQDARPYIGNPNGARETVQELKIEVIAPLFKAQAIVQAAKSVHPYEEMAYEIIKLQNQDQGIGAGCIGLLPTAISLNDFLLHVKEKMQAPVIRFTASTGKLIQKVAVCGGAGSSFLQTAIQQQADVFLTADFKYHQFFEAESKIVIADIGHFESEQYTVEIFYELIKINFPNFVVILSKTSTNPINYYY